MPLITKDDVFLFCGSPDDVQITHADSVDALIVSTQSELQDRMNRSLDEYVYSDIVLAHGSNCIIQGVTIYLMGMLRDTTTISTITEKGVQIDEYIDYENKGKYMLYQKIGVVQRTDGNFWSDGVGDIVISGTSHMQKSDVTQAMLEIVAIKSGLWKKTILTEGGNVTTEHSLSKPYAVVDKYIQADIF